jgi:cyclic beta-1,2-glucan synthetase
VKSNPVQDILSQFGIPFSGDNLLRKYANEKPPFRGELFSTDQMEKYGKTFATRHALVTGKAPNKLLKRLADNEKVLLEVHDLLTEAIKDNRRIIPAGEWLLDNFYLIQEQIRIGKKHLPKSYNKDLPLLLSGPSSELPRVYDIAVEIISHSDAQVDIKNLSNFIDAYQSVTYLNLGELWAIPIMLRLALIENLRRLTAQIAIDRINQNLADYWADKMIETAEKDPKSLILVIADMARSGPPMVSSFVAELARRLQGKGAALALPLTWIEQRLSESGQTINEQVNSEIQKQAADQVSMSNSINSLRFLGTTDWREFIEIHSIVDQILREEISGIYNSMDFSTRDRYRHVIENISRKSNLSEKEVAELANQLAKDSAAKNGIDDRTAHNGFFLVGNGINQTQKLAKMRLIIPEILLKTIHRFPLLIYVGSIILLTLLIGSILFWKAYGDGTKTWLLILLGVLLVLSVSQMAVSLVNWIMPLLVRPHLLPRIDFSHGIPPQFRSIVVIPTMLTSESEIEDLTESLEVRFLANKDDNLHFGLLTDFQDAHEETLPEDEPLARLAQKKIEELNLKYGGNTFFLFHRPRRLNPNDKIWMGYERKRGKLTELNDLLRGKGRDCFSLIVGDDEVFSKIKYIITLDSDTQLPRESARRMVGTMVHPLNRPFYDEKKQRVTDGYGILQPRVVTLQKSNSSLYAIIQGNDMGIDPYTRASSDVYQDLFYEGSFIGKGIYDVDIFAKTLNGRFPENRILSHDLLEGCYARSGLLSDVQLYEEYPSTYGADVKRRRRWTRGDWQIGAWFLPFVPIPGNHIKRNPLSGLSRWKILDNLRRSLVAPAVTLLLLTGWILLTTSWFWTLSVLAMLVLPFLISTARDVFRKPEDIPMREHFRESIYSAFNNFIQTLFTIVCLPYEAYYTLDSIIRTNWRMFISHRNLLAWNPSTNVQKRNPQKLVETYLAMWIAPVIGFGTLIYLSIFLPIHLITAWPLLIPWILSPAVAWRFSLPIPKQETKITAEQDIFLKKLARKTWAFFETFVGPGDNWLPPDNYQEQPAERIAHRTSPTNIGLSLLSSLAAWDFGFLTTGQFIERTTKTMTTMQGLERHRGHFYNWYDTLTLQPLHPKYISTVDSGNLAAHLLTFRHGILLMSHHKLITPRMFEGLRDTFLILKDKIKDNLIFEQFQKDLDSAIELKPKTVHSAKLCLEKLVKSSEEMLAKIPVDTESETYFWAQSLDKQVQSAFSDFAILMPWLLLPETPAKFTQFPALGAIPTLYDLSRMEIDLMPEIMRRYFMDSTAEEKKWLESFEAGVKQISSAANERIASCEKLAQQCIDFSNIEYDFLYDRSQHLLSIGYNVDEHRRDPGFYDLLASEARLSTFVGIAQGKLPQESWFALGRLLTNKGGTPILLSWSGSMFEYLMPHLIMPTYENTLLDQTDKAVVHKQIEYGAQRDVPWGMSESGYNMVDANLNYQYRAFGVPSLGFKRGLGEDLVIAPYATVLALTVAPEEASQNLQRLASDGFEGKFGFYEAIDYTPSRLPRGQSNVVIKSFMAHHQGMSLLSLDYLLLDMPMQKRFVSEPEFKATLLLLHERIPRAVAYYNPPGDISEINIDTGHTEMRIINTANTPVPEVQLLSNGKYHVMVTNAGGGYSRWKDIAVTRWREDTTCDNWGTFCYIRDLENGTFWSTGYQPALKKTKDYEVIFSQGRAEFRRRDNNFETHTEIVVSPEDDVEIRRVNITNRSNKRRSIEVTSYAEVVLASSVADALHPMFSNLFVQTEIIPDRHVILCTRRPSSDEQQMPWMFHLMTVHNAEIDSVSYETDRMEFIGRGNTIAFPQAMNNTGNLSGSQGPVLDPIVAIRYSITLDADETATVDMVVGIGETREVCKTLFEKYQDRHLTDRAFELAWTHSQVVLRQINANEGDAQLYARLAGSVIYNNAALRADQSILIKNRRGQSGLWGYSISGDLPIVLLQIEDPANIDLVKQLVQAHAYWRLKGLIVDLVIWNEDHGGYRQLLQNQLMGLISAGVETEVSERPGIFVRVADQISNEDRILFQTVARAIISDTKGTLEYQVNRRSITKTIPPYIIPKLPPFSLPTTLNLPNDLQFFNGFGGFSKDGREYVIITKPGEPTPAPWVNVLANTKFGSVISEGGQAYTWVENAHEFRLTPWNNDPVSDSSGEAFYIRDEESGYFWSPTPLHNCGKSSYLSRHGFGYSVFEHIEDGIHSELCVYVDAEATLKYMVLKIRNNSDRLRQLSATGYIEWVLGDLQPKSARHVITEIDSLSGALLARNTYNTEFGNRVCFFDVNDTSRTFTADRTEFIGRNGTLRSPDAMYRQNLSGRIGAALDPCAALQVAFDLAENEEREIIFILGTGRNTNDVTTILSQYRGVVATDDALDRVRNYWQKTLGAVQVETPDTSLNMLTNGWLLYQTLACRLLGRSGYYQSGGAFGFRDQLQDTMAIIHTTPQLTREHLLLCASRQFKEGDVQHWWHPPSGRGVRTRCSDDFLWLPFVACRYILSTGDRGVLDENVNFLEGRLLNAGEDSYYDLPTRSDQSATFYEHCKCAIDHGLSFGEHGLPLMGTGDWNDGMDKVGEKGKGESVWLAFFLYDILIKFIEIAHLQNDQVFADHCKNEADKLRENIEKNAWDGEWYRRAYFDDGTPLGSATNSECSIDSMPQSWAVLSKAGDSQRSLTAMQSADSHLVREDIKIIELLNPPFDKSNLNAGYIKGYVPGTRENGGQYTHAAIWLVMAFAALGDNKRTYELLNMLNPVHHGATTDAITTYKVEPYVIAADIYAFSMQAGHGGWTWYTGAAGWMYQLITESFLGLKLEVDKLSFTPCIPAEWKSFKLKYRYRETNYNITVLQTSAENADLKLTVDDAEQQNKFISLVDDKKEHSVEIKLSVVR